jgi:hypothetical protein
MTVESEQEDLIRQLKGIRRVVINRCFGGFSLSDLAQDRYCDLAGITKENLDPYGIKRDDPHLVQTVEELGSDADTGFSELKIVMIPADVQWTIVDYDGQEHVAEVHRTWA